VFPDFTSNVDNFCGGLRTWVTPQRRSCRWRQVSWSLCGRPLGRGSRALRVRTARIANWPRGLSWRRLRAWTSRVGTSWIADRFRSRGGRGRGTSGVRVSRITVRFRRSGGAERIGGAWVARRSGRGWR